jgi:hypothetical protein
VWWLARIALTLSTLVLAGFFIAAMGTEVGPLRAFDKPATPGLFGYQFVMGFAIILGWALGGAVEAVWKGAQQRATETPWELFAMAALPRLLGGLLVFFAIMGIEFGSRPSASAWAADSSGQRALARRWARSEFDSRSAPPSFGTNQVAGRWREVEPTQHSVTGGNVTNAVHTSAGS